MRRRTAKGREPTPRLLLLPTLFEGVPAHSPVCRDEIFGPVATVSRWHDFDAVLAEANDTRYGLAAVMWTRDLARSMQFIDAIEAGFVQVNQFSVAEASVEYGGTKISGIGRELSPESMLEHFTWSKTVIINYGTPGRSENKQEEEISKCVSPSSASATWASRWAAT